MENTKKLLIIIHFRNPFSHPRRGIEVFIENLYRILRRKVVVKILHPENFKPLRILKIPFLNRINPNFFQVYIPFKNESSWIYLPDLKSYFLGLFFYKKVIIGNHGLHYLNILNFLIYQLASFLIKVRSVDVRIHCINKFQEIFYSRILKIPSNRIFLIKNPIFINTYYKPVKTKKFNVLFLGSLSAQKGGDIIIETIKSFRKIHRIDWIIAGMIDKKFSKEFFELLKKQKNLKFFGYVSETKKRRLFQISCVFILPSRFEAQPITVLEALISGVPVILSDIPVFREIIGSEKTFGIILKNNDSESLKKSIMFYYDLFYKDMEKYKKLRLKIMRKARKIFSLKNFTKKFLRMMR